MGALQASYKGTRVIDIHCLQRMIGIKWQHRVPHLKIHHRAGIDSPECILAQHRLRWAGHVRLMPESRLPRQAMSGEMAESAGLRRTTQEV